MHLITSKWLKRQKCRQEKNNETKDMKEKEEIFYENVFIHLNTDHANAGFFFLIFLQTCSHSLNGINSLHCVM